MMSDLPEDIKREIWERDRYRCRECGIKVGQDRGLRPHTHHKIPKALRGSDEEKNLITLCQPCHTARLTHTFMLTETPVEDFPQYIKHALWEISLNLLAYADYLDPRSFPAAHQVIEHIEGFQKTLEKVRGLAEICQQNGIGEGALTFEEDLIGEIQQVEGIIEGMRIAWTSHYTQRALDQIIGQRLETLAEQIGVRCLSCHQGKVEYLVEEEWQGFRCKECGWRSPSGNV